MKDKRQEEYLVAYRLQDLIKAIADYVVIAGKDNNDILRLERYARVKLKKLQSR